MSESAVLSNYNSTLTTAEPVKTNILNASHRCDSCSAAAFVRVLLLESTTLPTGSYLQFCGHHFQKNELALIPYMDGKPIDERYKLTWDRHMGTENS